MAKKTYTVLVPDIQYDDLDIEKSITGEGVNYHVFHEVDPLAIPEREWRNCDALLVWHRMTLDSRVIEQLDQCRMIVRVGVGFDNVDIRACSKKGIPVANVPNYGTTEVADHALALLLNLVRGISTFQDRLRDDLIHGFRAENVPVVRRLRGATFGSVGLGRIGKVVS